MHLNTFSVRWPATDNAKCAWDRPSLYLKRFKATSTYYWRAFHGSLGLWNSKHLINFSSACLFLNLDIRFIVVEGPRRRLISLMVVTWHLFRHIVHANKQPVAVEPAAAVNIYMLGWHKSTVFTRCFAHLCFWRAMLTCSGSQILTSSFLFFPTRSLFGRTTPCSTVLKGMMKVARSSFIRNLALSLCLVQCLSFFYIAALYVLVRSWSPMLRREWFSQI